MRCFRCRTEIEWANAERCPRCGISGFLRSGMLLKSGEYRLEWPLGKGGLGVTYQALHQRLQKSYAIKEFFPGEYAIREPGGRIVPLSIEQEFYRELLDRFIGEGHKLAQIHHPNVVRAVDLFEENGTAYLVMDLIKGRTFKEELDEAPGRRLPEARVRAVMSQLVAALEVVHEQKIYHCDLKPDNVMVTGGERIVLVDFGAARQGIARTEASSTNSPMFTRNYAAPEVIAGRRVGPYSDLFELGMMLHEMLSGKLPPSAVARSMKASEFNMDGWEEPWSRLLATALEMDEEVRKARVGSVAQWWGYEAHYRERLRQLQQEHEERFQLEEKERTRQEIRRLRNENERLAGVVQDLQVRESQALGQIYALDEEVERRLMELDEQAEKLQWLERYEPLIAGLELVGRTLRDVWQLYVQFVRVLLEFFGRREWLVKGTDVEKRHAERMAVVLVVLCVFLLLFIWFRR